MEPLFEKLARQTVVRKLREGIRACDRRTDLMRVRCGRFFIATICAMMAIVVVSFTDLCFIDDSESHKNTAWENAMEVITFTAAWPLVAGELVLDVICPHAPNGVFFVAGLALLLVSGMFWAWIFELIRKRINSRKQLAGLKESPPAHS